jgi:predicted dehydrogenase
MNAMTASNGLSRREFLQSTVAVGAGLVLAPTILAQDKPPPSDDINVALIGCGMQGRNLLEQAVKIKGLRFKAACDIWPYAQDLAPRLIKGIAKQEAAVYADHQEMLAKEKNLQAAIVATPDWMHAEHSIACMKAGLAVYCEKPISNDLAQARAMVEASRKTGRLLQIGHQRRSSPLYLHCLEKLLGEAQLLGRIRAANAQWNRSITATGPRGYPKGKELDDDTLKKYGYDTMDRFRDWRQFKKFGGGPFADLGSHQIDVLAWFLGAMPASVTASATSDYYKDKGWEFPDSVMAVYEFQTPKDPILASYQMLSTSSSGKYFEKFMGTDGALTVSEDRDACRAVPEGHLFPAAADQDHPWQKWEKKGYLTLAREVEKVVGEENTNKEADFLEKLKAECFGEPKPVFFVPKYEGMEQYAWLHLPHLANFFDALRGKGKLNCPGEVGYATAVAVLRAYDAAETGRKVAFKPEEFKL